MKNTKGSSTWKIAYNNILNQISRGILSPGEKLDEINLSEVLHVSRTPIREALKNLEGAGYITITPNKGSFVKKYSLTELDNIYRIISKLEGLAVYLASQNFGKNELGELQKMHKRMENFFKENSYKNYLDENIKFHGFFTFISKNTVLEDIINQLRKKVFMTHYFAITIGHIDEFIHDHEQILKALNNKKFKRASKYMEIHVDRVRQILLNFYKTFQ